MGRKTTETGPAGNQTTYVYDDSGRVLTETRLLEDATNPNTTAVTSYDYQDYAGAYPLVAESRPDGVSITHTYDWVGNETKVTDPRNAELGVSWDWQTVYDAQDRITESWTPDPDGGGTKLPLKTITSFSVLPFQTTVTDPAGVKSVTQMDVLGRVTVSQGSVSATGGLAPTYTTYDGAGNVKRVEQKDASKSYSWIEHTYNAYGQVLTDKAPWRDDANGATFRTLTATHEYYPTGLPKKIDGPLGLDFSTTNPNEAGTADPTEKDVTTYDYNLEGWMKSATYWTSDVKSWTTDAYYNDAGEQTQLRTQLTGGQTPTYQTRRWTYTPAGLVAGSTEFHGTAQGAPCQGASTPGKCTTSNTYDEGGRLISTTDDRPCTVTNTYDLLSQLTDRVASGSGCSGNEHFAYWANGAQKQAKQNATGAASTFNMEYDFMGRPTYVKKGATTVSSYAYKTLSGQETGQLDSVTTSGVTTSYGWCAASSSGCFIGLLQTVDEPLLSGVTTYTYEAAGRVETRKDVNGTWTLTWERKYEDQTGRSNTQTIKKGTNVLGDFDVDYDEAGNIIKRKENVGTDARNSTWTYGYDAASRMISATGKDPATTSGPPTLTWNYAYDGAGNRISATKPSGTGTISYTLDGQGWPVSDDNGAGTKYAYDPVGDLTLIDKDGTTTTNDWSFTFDAWSRTTQARKGLPGSPTLTVDYQIDALGRMGRRTTGGSYVDYIYEGTSENLVTSTPSTGSATTFTSTPGGPLAQKTGTAAAQVLLRDLHGDVVGAVNTGATSPASTQWYSAWGERTGSSSELGFQGQWTDGSTSQVDMLTRMYQGSLGRFSSRDALFGEIRNPLTLNQHAYAAGNPISYSDPTGLSRCDDSATPGCGETLADPDDVGSQPPDQGTVDVVNNNRGAIATASHLFGVPKSVIAAIIAAEHLEDPQKLLSQFLETACGLPIGPLGHVSYDAKGCETASFGTGQIQLRRGQMLDPFVRERLVQALGPAGAVIDSLWNSNNDALIGRLKDDNTNILYVAAYISRLRSAAPAGASWGDVYQNPYVESLGSYNGYDRFRRAFDTSLQQFHYIDTQVGWGTDQHVVFNF